MQYFSNPSLRGRISPVGMLLVPWTFPTKTVKDYITKQYKTDPDFATVTRWWEAYKNAQLVYQYARYEGDMQKDYNLLVHMEKVTGSRRQDILQFMTAVMELGRAGKIDLMYWDAATNKQTEEAKKKQEEPADWQKALKIVFYGGAALILLKLFMFNPMGVFTRGKKAPAKTL